MKLIACDLCHDVIQLKYEIRSCTCGNIKGNYIDKRNVKIHIKDGKRCRVLGLSNAVRYGIIEGREFAWVIKFTDVTVKELVKIGGKNDENK